MFLRIVAEMTTKNKSYGDYFPADSIALFIVFLPSITLSLFNFDILFTIIM